MKNFTILVLLMVLSFSTIQAQQEVYKPTLIQKAAYFDISPPLRDIPVIEPGYRDRKWKDGVIKNKLNMPEHRNLPVPYATPADYANAQTRMGTRASELLLTINGVGNLNGVLPPDTQGDVGPNHYMQMVNLSMAIWNKSGTMIYGPVDNKTLWNGFPGPWSGSNDGDPIVLYDEQADRWVASQFALPNYPNGPFYELIAVSQTGDPTGAWYRYAYTFTNMPDYPKLGVWHDGYYLSVNSFTSGSLNWAGTGVAALDRDKMLIGDPNASMIFFTTPSGGDPSTFQPADCDGNPAPAGSPGLFGYIRDGNPDRFVIYALNADWTTPANSTFSQLILLPVDSYSSSISGIPQKGTSTTLQSIADRLMYRLQYRNFGSYQAMVTNHTVNVSGHAGIRWYEFRNYGSGWEIYQQGTYSPDATSRWMGSIAMNSYGDIALGFSASSSSLYPSIRFTGRRASDPLGEMTFAEQDIMAGGGSQTSFYQRWGDYSMMSVDPAVDSVFWYTQEYYQTTSNQNWKTAVGSFSFGVPLNVTATATPEQICLGDSSQLNAEVSGGNGTITYLWTAFPGSYTSNLQNPVVYPDATTQYHLTITSGVNTASTTVTVTVNPLPTVAVSDDMTACEGEVVRVMANATNHASILWTSSGDGSFADPTIARADYTPGPQDIATGAVTLTATVESLYGCSSAEDFVVLTIVNAALAAAGSPYDACSGQPVQLNGTAANYSSVLWTSAGDGTFADATIADAVYTPGAGDQLAGYVNLAFTAYGMEPCGDSTSTTTVTLIPAPASFAGDDAAVCAGQSAVLMGTATEYTSVQWTTPGDGQFTDPASLTTNYLPGNGDINAGQVSLSLNATGNAPCATTSDQILLTIHQLPEVAAGNDTTICKTSSIQLSGSAQNFASVLWTTSGNGTFDNPSALATRYLPGTNDTIQGNIVLTLTNTGQFGCGTATDTRTIQFAQCLGIENNLKPSVRILPNPSSGKVTIEVRGLPGMQNFRLKLLDAGGSVVLDEQYTFNSQLFRHMLDLTSNPRGIYVLQIFSGTEILTSKIMLQ